MLVSQQSRECAIAGEGARHTGANALLGLLGADPHAWKRPCRHGRD